MPIEVPLPIIDDIPPADISGTSRIAQYLKIGLPQLKPGQRLRVPQSLFGRSVSSHRVTPYVSLFGRDADRKFTVRTIHEASGDFVDIHRVDGTPEQSLSRSGDPKRLTISITNLRRGIVGTKYLRINELLHPKRLKLGDVLSVKAFEAMGPIVGVDLCLSPAPIIWSERGARRGQLIVRTDFHRVDIPPSTNTVIGRL